MSMQLAKTHRRMLAEAGCPIDALLPSTATKAPGGPGAVQPSTLDLWLERMMKEELPEGSSGRALALTRTLLECAVAQGSAQRAPLLAAVSQIGRMGSSELALLGQASRKLTSRGRALQPPLAAYDVHPWQRMLRPQPRPTGLGFSLQQHRWATLHACKRPGWLCMACLHHRHPNLRQQVLH